MLDNNEIPKIGLKLLQIPYISVIYLQSSLNISQIPKIGPKFTKYCQKIHYNSLIYLQLSLNVSKIPKIVKNC